MMPSRLNTPTRKVASVMVLIGVGGGIVYAIGWAKAWMPNVVVGAITVAVTITVVEQAIRSEAQRRIQPHVEDVLRAIGDSFASLLAQIAFDYAQDSGDSSAPIPAGAIEVIDLWLSRRKSALRFDWIPSLIGSSEKFADRLEYHRQRDRQAIPLDLIRAIDRYQARIKLRGAGARMYYESPADTKPRAIAAFSQREAVKDARDWTLVYNSVAPERLTMSEPFREVAQRLCSSPSKT